MSDSSSDIPLEILNIVPSENSNGPVVGEDSESGIFRNRYYSDTDSVHEDVSTDGGMSRQRIEYQSFRIHENEAIIPEAEMTIIPNNYASYSLTRTVSDNPL